MKRGWYILESNGVEMGKEVRICDNVSIIM
jgi:hypothetical protein